MHLSTFHVFILLSFAALFTETVFALPILLRMSSHQQVSFLAQNYRPIIKHKYDHEESAENQHKNENDSEEHHCRNEPADNLEVINAYRIPNTSPFKTEATSVADNMDGMSTSTKTITFQVRLDHDNCYQPMRSINGAPDDFCLSITDTQCNKRSQPWYRRWLSLWDKTQYDKDCVEDANWNGPQLILSQLVSMLPLKTENDSDLFKVSFIMLPPFSRFDHNSFQGEDVDSKQIQKRLVKDDAVMQVISSDVLF